MTAGEGPKVGRLVLLRLARAEPDLESLPSLWLLLLPVPKSFEGDFLLIGEGGDESRLGGVVSVGVGLVLDFDLDFLVAEDGEEEGLALKMFGRDTIKNDGGFSDGWVRLVNL